jgi:hypothetical protein
MVNHQQENFMSTILHRVTPLALTSGSTDHEAAPTSMDPVGFELGWDFARHGVTPPLPYAEEASPLRHGWTAGQVAFAGRTLSDRPAALQWLQLRLHAWLRGRHVELFQITPHYLRQLAVSHCPVTRVELTGSGAHSASIDRVRNDAAYAAGNLVVMSQRANHSKGGLGYHEALSRAQHIADAQLGGVDGLTQAQWLRVATLCSFVEPLSHEVACHIPMRVLPPKRLRLFNPAQALQAFVSQQLLQAGWSQRVSRFEALLPSEDLRRDFKRFFMALLPRVIEAGRPTHALGVRWAIEDAWGHAAVLEKWAQFALQLSPVQCEALLVQATKKGLGTCLLDKANAAQATEGWSLSTRGYSPSGPATERSAMVQLSLLS